MEYPGSLQVQQEWTTIFFFKEKQKGGLTMSLKSIKIEQNVSEEQE